MKSKNLKRLFDALEPRQHLDGTIELLPGVPFSRNELTELGVEVVSRNGVKSYAFDGQFVLQMGGIHGGKSTQIQNAQAYLDSIPALKELKRSFAGDVRIQKQLGGDGQFLLKTDSEISLSAIKGAISGTNKFRSIEPNALIWAASRTPNDTNWGSQTSWMTSQMQVPQAWDLNVGGTSSLVVAVVDTGIDVSHPDLTANLWKNPGETPNDNVDNDNNGFVDDYYGFNFAGVENANVFDDNGHGTHVAGIIGATGNNNRGVAGVNWNTKLMSLKVLNSSGAGSAADATKAVNYIAARLEGGLQVKVMNISWELPSSDSALQTAVTRYQTAGGLLVASAGNNGNTNLTYPAAYTNANIISVANVASNDVLFNTSSYGSSWVDLAAPGTNILSTLPANQYGTQTGTSQAAAFVSGAAALLWDAIGTGTTAATIRNAILNNVDTNGSLSGNVATGGRLNVLRAAQALAPNTPWAAVSATPAIGGVVTSGPTEFTINFSSAVQASSIQATDLTVNSIPANTFQLMDPDTVKFTFAATPVTVGGPQNMAIAASALTRSFDNRGIAAFSGSFGFDDVPLIVSSTSPNSGDVVAVPVTTLDFTFNEEIDFDTVAPSDLTLSQGTATAVQQLSPTSVRFTLSGVVDESSGSVNITLQANQINDTHGYGNTQFLMVLSLDNPPQVVTDFVPIGVPGGKAYRISSPILGSINPSGDSDEYLVSLDPNQRLTVSINADATLQPLIEVFDSTNLLLGRDSPDTIGKDALLQSLLITSAGQYRIKISSEQGTLGSYSMNVQLNAAEEVENRDQANNNIKSTPQPIDTSFTTEASGATRVAVTGIGSPSSEAVRVAAFSEEFGAPVLPTGWSTYSGSANGRVRVTNLYGGFMSPTALVMDRSPNGPYTLNEATWTMDLTGNTNPVLTFAHNDLGDEEHTIPSSYTSRVNGDGISISTNGVNWYRVWTPADQPVGEWRTFSIDLAAAAQANGLTLGAGTRIKFQQFDNQAAPADGRAFDAVKVVADAQPEDWYSFVASSGQSVSVALKTDTANTAIRVDLYSPSGALLTTGVTAAPWADQLINSLTATASGTYLIRVYGNLPAAAPYTLNVSKGAAMDVEPNTNPADSQDPGTPVVLGQIESGDAGDRYRYNVRAGDVINITTTTPGDGANLFTNTLNPAVELLGPTNAVVASATGGNADGRNVTMSYVATQNGVFTVRVFAESGTGEYVLRTTGPSGGTLPFVVTAITPSNNALPTNSVTQILVDVSSSVISSTVDAADLKINGIGADTVSVVDYNTLLFGVNSALLDGTYAISISAGAFTSLQNRPIDAFSSSFRVDLTPPKVVATSIVEGGYVGTGTITYTATFSEALLASNFDTSDFVLDDLLNVGTSYTASSFLWDSNDNSLTLTWDNIPETELRLTLLSGNGRFEDVAGLDLDGEPTWPIGSGSGNGTPGGNFVVNFASEAVIAPFGTMTRQSPDGSLIYAGNSNSKIDFTGDTDTFTLDLEDGQVLSFEILGSVNVAPVITLFDPTGATITTASASAGGTARIQTAAIETSGVYTIEVASSAGLGTYSLKGALNASYESSAPNDSIATAQSLASTFIVPRFGFDRGGVIGSVEANGSDYFSFTLPSGSSMSAVLAAASSIGLQIYNPNGDLMISGSAGASPIVAAVSNLTSSGNGTYYARVVNTSGTAVPYRLAVVRNGSFDVETNDTLILANDAGLFGTALGAVSTASDVDLYKFSVASGDTLTISTLTPGDDTGLFNNILNPIIDLYDPSGVIVATDDNSAPDGRNAVITHAASGAGVYTVRVRSAGSTDGEYVLTVGGFSGGLLPLTVTSTDPVDNAVLPSSPTTFTANFSAALLASTVQASDLVLNGSITATGFSFQDADTVVFTLPAGLTDNVYNVTIAAGAVENLDATGNQAFSSSFRVDLTAPRLMTSSIAQNNFLATGSLTYTATFNERLRNTQLDPSDIILHGNTTNTNFTATSVSYDTNTETLTATFANLPEQRYKLTLTSADGAFEDIAGLNLDGEPTWPIPVQGTGNGTAGGNFFVDFDLEVVNAPFALPLTQVAPAGSQIYRGTQTSKIDFLNDVDIFSLDLDAGQTLSLSMQGTTVVSRLTVKDPGGAVLGTVTGGSAGAFAVLRHLAATTAGTYTIEATSPSSTSGAYTIELGLNTDLELEERGGTTNNTVATAQSVNTSFDAIAGTGASRAGVLGRLGTSTADRFAIYVDSFEAPTFGPAWSFYKSTTAGRIQRTSVYGGSDGTFAMVMDVSPAGSDLILNEAMWTVNLAGLNAPKLAFSHRNIGDEVHALPATFTGHANGDGVSISMDGVSWFTVATTSAVTIGSTTIPALPSSALSAWGNWEVDLVAAATQAGFNLNGNMIVKFQQYDNLSIGSDGRAWDNVQITVAGTSDFYSFSAAIGDKITAAVTGSGSAVMDLRIFDNAGNVVFTGSQLSGGDVDTLVDSFTATTAGTYRVRVAASLSTAEDYGLLLMKNATFNAEPTPTTPQVLSSPYIAQGALTVGDEDVFSITLAANQQITIKSFTPGDGSGQFVNNLNPRLELSTDLGTLLQSDDNSASDGHNAQMSFTAPAAGTYRIRVLAESGTGEYTLQVIDNGFRNVNGTFGTTPIRPIGTPDKSKNDTIGDDILIVKIAD